MPGTAGRKARAKLSIIAGGAGAYNVIKGIRSISHSIDGTTVDDSEFGDDWMQRIQGLKDGKVTLSGNRRLDDANGQNALLSALLDDDVEVWIQVLPDNGTTVGVGFRQQMKIAKFGSDSTMEGANGISIELEGNGPITLI